MPLFCPLPSSRALASLCALAPTVLATPLYAGPVYEDETGGTFTYYGQFSPAYSSVDDGVDSFGNVADSDLSNSRVGLRLAQPFETFTFGFRAEVALGFPLTSEYDQTGLKDGVGGWDRGDFRFLDASFEGGWGKLSVGQGSMAADGAAEISLGAISGVIYQYTGDGNGFYQFRDPGGALSGVRVEDAFGTFDGARRTRLRYDTPSYAGFTVGAAIGTNELSSSDDDTYADIGVFYDQTYGGTQVRAGLAYQYRDRDGGGETTSWVASTGVLLDSGVGFALGYGAQDDTRAGRSDPSWYYAQLSYEADLWSVGQTAFGIDYYSGSDFVTDGSDSGAWGIGVIQQISAYDIEVYASYRDHSFDEPGTDYQDLASYLIGVRWKF